MSTEIADRNWKETVKVFFKPRSITLLFLGFAAGLPILLVFSTLSAWLREAGVSRSTIGFFSWVGMMYSIKYFWAPVVDRVKIPLLGNMLGRRRSWMLLAQMIIIIGIVGMAMTDPELNLYNIAVFALILAFGSATQDIAIDAFRIEAAPQSDQAALAANYVYGYRIAMLLAGAGALYMADWFDWRTAYLLMAFCMAVGIATVFITREPDEPERKIAPETEAKSGDREFAGWLFWGFFLIVNIQAAYVTYLQTGRAPKVFLAFLILILLVIAGFAFTRISFFQRAYSAMVLPIVDFFSRNGWKAALLILGVVGLFRFTDITLGIMANPFYIDLGYTKSEIASIAKVWGLLMTLIGLAIGGLLTARYSFRTVLLLAAGLAAASNLFFAALAGGFPTEGVAEGAAPPMAYLAGVISADNLAAGIATTVFIAWLSSLTNTAFTATQYALFSSLMTLPGKFVSGYGGVVVDGYGYQKFFTLTALLGIPVMLLILFLPKLMGRDGEMARASE